MKMATYLSRTILIHHNKQTRCLTRPAFPNKLVHYLRRAELIDSIRVALRSPNQPTSLPALLNTRLLDSFVVTHSIRSSPDAVSALALLQSLESVPRFEHSKTTLHALATVLAKSRMGSEFESLVGDVKAGKHGNVEFSFMELLKWYFHLDDLQAVLTTWEEYRHSSDHVCTESYNIVMSTYVKLWKDREAVGIFCGLIDEGAIPNSRTYTIVIEHLIRSGRFDQAIVVFGALPLMRIKRTLRQYFVLIQGFVGVGRYDVVKDLVGQMRVDGMFPGRHMRMALQQLKEAGFVEDAEVFLREMFPDSRIKDIGARDYGVDDDYSDCDDEDDYSEIDSPTCEIKLKPWLDPKALANALEEWNPEVLMTLENAKFVWTTRLVCKILRNFSSPETAWDFFCWVAYQPGFTHDIYTVQRMMSLLARHGRVELVDRLLIKVRSEGMRLPFSTIRLIIDFYGVSKNADAAFKVFREDRALCGPLMKYNMMLLYSSLLRTLTKCKRDADAIEVLEEMVLHGVHPDIQTFSGLMYHFAIQGDIKTVQKIFTMVRQCGVQPDAYMFKILIQAYCKCERASLAWRVFEDMRNLNLMLDAATKNLLVKSLWNEGKRKEAALVEESCEDMNDVLPLVTKGHIWTGSFLLDCKESKRKILPFMDNEDQLYSCFAVSIKNHNNGRLYIHRNCSTT